MFNETILELQSQIQYHTSQLGILEEELYKLKSYEEFSNQAYESVKETIEQIQDPKYLELFKEGLLSLFPIFPNEPIYLEEVAQETNDYVEKINSYPLPASASPEVAAFILKECAVPEKKKKEFGPLSYCELTGKPDLRPDTYEDLAPHITYSSSGRAYVRFNDRREAEEFKDSISKPAMISDTETMNGHKFEVKFYCDREYLQQFIGVELRLAVPTERVKCEGEQVGNPNFEKIDGEIIYNHVDSICYIAFSAKGRADNYGSYLTRILDIAEKYTVSKDPQIVDAKYELRLEGCSFDDALHLQSFNLKKDWDHSDNKEVRKDWQLNRKRPAPQAYKPAPKLIPLEEIELGEIVYLNSVSNQYKVVNKVELDDQLHLEVVCVYNKQMKTLVGQISYLKECYRVPLDDVHMQEISHPSLKSNELTTEDFTAPPYQKISLNEIEVCDIVSTGEYVKAYYEITEHKGSYLIGKCIHHDSLKMRIGQECNLVDPYLVEKAILPTSVEAHFTRSHLLSSSEDGAVGTETSKIMAVA